MARQLDFNPLDFRQSILSDPAGKAWSQGISQVGDAASGIIKGVKDEKRRNADDFVEQMKYDTAITGNNIVNNRVASEYGKVRNKWVDVFKERKGKLSPEDKINMNSDLQALDSMTNTFKSTVDLYETAKKTALSKQGGGQFDLNNQKWANLMTIASGQDNTPDLLQFMNDVRQSDTEIPFLDYKPYDINILDKALRKGYRSEYKGDVSETSDTVDVGGRRFTRSKKTTSYGDPDSAKDYFKTGFLSNDRAVNYTKGLQQSFTDQQKQEAMAKYGPEGEDPSDKPFLDYYVNDVWTPDQWTQETEFTRAAAKPAPTGGGGGISIAFGGRTPSKGDLTPKEDNVNGVELTEYVEFAKARPAPKMVKGVTVKGASELSSGREGDPSDITEPNDYEVIGYDGDKDAILLRNKVETGIYDTYMAPREGNEHFLQGLLTEKTLEEIKNKPKKEPVGVSGTKWEKYKR